MSSEVVAVLCTFPDETVARQIGALVVENQAAACVNVLPGVTSVFRWEGKVEEETEVLAVIKTTRAGYDRLERMIVEAHPYDEPEVIALPVTAGSRGYLDWVGESVSTNDE